MTIDIKRFCAMPDEDREYLRQPFCIGACTYAANGHIIVRVPADEIDAAELPLGNKLIASVPALYLKWMRHVPLPELPPTSDCEFCSGRGWHKAKKCPSCDGGTFDRYDHTYDCLYCEHEPVVAGYVARDSGELQLTCNRCYGRGAEQANFRIEPSYFELAYLHWIAALPGAVILTHGTKEPMSFRFDGGEGLLMPLNY